MQTRTPTAVCRRRRAAIHFILRSPTARLSTIRMIHLVQFRTVNHIVVGQCYPISSSKNYLMFRDGTIEMQAVRCFCRFCSVVPNNWGNGGSRGWPGSPTWSIAYVIIPGHILQYDRDHNLIKTHYNGLKVRVYYYPAAAEVLLLLILRCCTHTLW